MKTKFQIHLKLDMACIGNYQHSTCRRIPHSPNSLNSMHWAIKAKWKKAWESEIFYQWEQIKKDTVKKYPKIEFPLKFKAKLKVYIFCIKPQDPDNAVAGCKGVIDGIVKAGILKDDDYNNLAMPEVLFVPVATRKAEHVELNITKN